MKYPVQLMDVDNKVIARYEVEADDARDIVPIMMDTKRADAVTLIWTNDEHLANVNLLAPVAWARESP